MLNNVNLDKLPQHVIDAIYAEFSKLDTQRKLIVYARLMHGSLYKTERLDIMKPYNTSVAKIYDKFLKDVGNNIKGVDND